MSGARDVLRRADRHGVQVRIDGHRLHLKAIRKPPDDLVADLRKHKPEITALVSGEEVQKNNEIEWDETDWQALYDERAAIMEFDGGLPRAEAEARASEEVAKLRAAAERRNA